LKHRLSLEGEEMSAFKRVTRAIERVLGEG